VAEETGTRYEPVFADFEIKPREKRVVKKTALTQADIERERAFMRRDLTSQNPERRRFVLDAAYGWLEGYLPKAEAEPVSPEDVSGMEIRDAARKFNLPDTTVRRMANGLGEQLVKVGEKKLDSIGDMLVSLIQANTEGMRAIALQATDVEYLEKHGPTALSDLYSTLADTTVRLLEAAGPVAEAGDTARQ
jgi:hypothetical protein